MRRGRGESVGWQRQLAGGWRPLRAGGTWPVGWEERHVIYRRQSTGAGSRHASMLAAGWLVCCVRSDFRRGRGLGIRGRSLPNNPISWPCWSCFPLRNISSSRSLRSLGPCTNASSGQCHRGNVAVLRIGSPRRCRRVRGSGLPGQPAFRIRHCPARDAPRTHSTSCVRNSSEKKSAAAAAAAAEAWRLQPTLE